MARYPTAIWDPILKWPTGPYASDGDPEDWKHVTHKTQGHTYPRVTYSVRGGVPHFTITKSGTVYQHYDTTHYSRALLNLPGGAQTNLDQAIQTELVGFVGTTMPGPQMAAYLDLCHWLKAVHGLPLVWLNGRPGQGQPRLSASAWDAGTGHVGHSDVPENDHTDPGFTDFEWASIVASFNDTPEEVPVQYVTYGKKSDERMVTWSDGAAVIWRPDTRHFYVRKANGDVVDVGGENGGPFGRVIDVHFCSRWRNTVAVGVHQPDLQRDAYETVEV